jgi:DNA polymerase-3 subunit alpha
MAASGAHFKAEDAGQMSLFGGESGAVSFVSLQLPKVKVAVSKRDMLSWEKELIGLYVSDHPLQSVIDQVGQIVTHYAGQLTEEDHGKPVVMAGVVSTIRAHTTKKGDPMGFVGVEDLQGQLELVIFPRVWREVSAWLTVEQIVIIYGKADTQGGGNPKILVDSLRQDFKVAAASNGNGKPNGHGPTPAQAILWEPDQFRPPARAPEPPPPDDWLPPPDDDWITGAETVEDRGPRTANRDSRAGAPPVPPFASLVMAPAGMAGDAKPALAPVASSGLAQVVNDPAAPAMLPASPSSSVAVRGPRTAFASSDARRVIIQLLNTGDKDKDLRLLRHVHGLLSSYPGQDEFEFEIHERNRHYQLRFPNHNTDYTPELAAELTRLLGRSGTVIVR